MLGSVKILLGDGVAIRDDVIIAGSGTLIIGDNTSVNARTIIACYGHMTIGRNTMIAPMSYLLDIDHEIASTELPIALQGYRTAPVFIGDDVWIGAQTVIVKGVTIGNGAIVGANSFVNRDIPSLVIAAGSPAKVIRSRCQDVAL